MTERYRSEVTFGLDFNQRGQRWSVKRTVAVHGWIGKSRSEHGAYWYVEWFYRKHHHYIRIDSVVFDQLVSRDHRIRDAAAKQICGVVSQFVMSVDAKFRGGYA